MKRCLLACTALLPFSSGPGPSAQQTSAVTPTIMFVCEHGAAKSLIATVYFNKLASEAGLPDRAMFRGTNPQAELSQTTVAGLKADGLEVPSMKPTAIAQQDVDRATYIFAIGCPLPANAASSGKAADWSDVPEGQGYAAARDAIRKHVEQLIADLVKRSGR